MAFVLQKTFIYKRIGSGRLPITKKLLVKLEGFFDVKAFYTFYEEEFHRLFIKSLEEVSNLEARNERVDIEIQRSGLLDLFNSKWKQANLEYNLGSAEYTLLNALFLEQPKKIYLFNTPKELSLLIREASQIVSRDSRSQIIDLNAFSDKLELGDDMKDFRPFIERIPDIVNNFHSEDFFLFGIDEPIPPLNHIKEVFTRIIPKIPGNMRVGVYGISPKTAEDIDEWIKWNVSFWSAETLLEILISNSEDLITEWDSRNLDFSQEEHFSLIDENRCRLFAKELMIFRRAIKNSGEVAYPRN
jgi:hypothetical protein